ncbi:cell wall-binding repeat-containing protein [Fredinandcohnia sp. FSL W7-1320]|uniref:cell wall-binding repeat-containing protein n=1 Tax=Fredinandcohnia sp. FSL W7-1320 TaxID=2954540 RepID=UPI0030FD8A8F
MKKYFILLVLPLVLLLFANSAIASGTAERVDGKDRFQVAVNLSQKGWPTQSDTVVLSFYNAYADALTSGPLAYHYNAPILLTHNNNLTDVTKKEIARLKPNRVVVVGGPGSIADSVLNELRKMGIKEVTRINGEDRFEVAANVAKQLPGNKKAVIADGLNFPDALAISPYASQNKIPILLTRPKAMPQATKQTLSSLGITSTIVVGGEASVSKTVYGQLPTPMRISGEDRYEVAANIIRQLKLPTGKAYLSTGATFADALTGSVLAAKENAPILLTRSDKIPDPTRKIISERKISNYVVLGGLGSIPQKIVAQLSGKLAGLTIVVDAGHGGTDPGAIGNGLKESDIVLDISRRLQPKLEAAGVNVVMTRATNKYITLDDRVKAANDIGANAFISIHNNAYSDGSANGTETYWNDTYAGQESKELATEIQKELVKQLGTRDRGVKEGNFKVIRETTMVSVLVEVAFITNQNDAQKLASAAYREKATNAIYQGILNYYGKN